MKKEKKYPKKTVEQVVFRPNPKHEWSEYQKEIFIDINKGEGHTIVEALAGSGKTSSLIQSLKYIPKGKKVLLLAFNKAIQQELERRAPPFVYKYTFHSLGLQAVKARFGAVEINAYKAVDIAKKVTGSTDYDLINSICKTVDFCKYSLTDAPSKIEAIIDNFNIDLIETDKELFIKYVVNTLKACKLDTKQVDFNDMCWFVYVYNLPVMRADIILIDEYQDINKAHAFVARKAGHENSRYIFYGDKNQTIYQFLLADSSFKNELLSKPNAKILTLPITYRCPKKVVDIAKIWAPNIICPENAIEGNIEDISINEIYDKVTPGSYIISRTNAPLIPICLKLISLNKKANIKGKDIGAGLLYLIKKSNKKTINGFLSWLSKWKDEEFLKLKSKNINPDNMLDRYECLVNICEESSSIEDAKKKIKDIFHDTEEENIIILGSVHGLKGKESKNVYLLKWTFGIWLPNLKDQEFEKSEDNCEGNLNYVAFTRSKENVYIVNKF